MDCSVLRNNSVYDASPEFGPDPVDFFGFIIRAKLLVDLYSCQEHDCHRGLLRARGDPDGCHKTEVITILTGPVQHSGPESTEVTYERIALYLAAAYPDAVVAVLRKPVAFGPQQLNFPIPTDFVATIRYLQSTHSPIGPMEIEALYPGGWSAGGSYTLYMLDGLCPGYICQQGPDYNPVPPLTMPEPVPYEIPPDQKELIKKVWSYAGTSFASSNGPFTGTENLRNLSRKPVLLAFGSGEENVRDRDEGVRPDEEELRGQKTFRNLNVPKTFVVIKGLDHGSFPDYHVSGEDIEESVLSPDEEAELIGKTLVEWIKFDRDDDPRSKSSRSRSLRLRTSKSKRSKSKRSNTKGSRSKQRDSVCDAIEDAGVPLTDCKQFV